MASQLPTLSVRLTPGQREFVERRAAELGVSLSRVVSIALAMYEAAVLLGVDVDE